MDTVDIWPHAARPRARNRRGSDDAGLFLDAQARGGSGGYAMVGADNPAPHLHPAFDVDERALAHGVHLLEALVRDAG